MTGNFYYKVKNLVLQEGHNDFANVYFGSTSKRNNFYIFLYQNNYTPVYSDTLTSLLTNASEFVNYDETTRQLYNNTISSSALVSNDANKAIFTFNTSGTIYGSVICTSSTKNSSAGIAVAAAKFSSSKTVNAGEALTVKYEIQFSN